MSRIDRWASGAEAALLKEISSCWIRRRLDSLRLLFCGLAARLTRIAESARSGAGSAGERIQKYSGFTGCLPNEEYAAASHDFAEPNLPDQQLPAQAAKELYIVQRAR
jgi:hypothetical protein